MPLLPGPYQHAMYDLPDLPYVVCSQAHGSRYRPTHEQQATRGVAGGRRVSSPSQDLQAHMSMRSPSFPQLTSMCGWWAPCLQSCTGPRTALLALCPLPPRTLFPPALCPPSANSQAGVAGGQLVGVRPVSLDGGAQGAQAANGRAVGAGEELEECALVLCGGPGGRWVG